MLQSFLNKFCKQVSLDISLMVKMSLSEGYAWQFAAVMTLYVFQAVLCSFLHRKSKMANLRKIFFVRTPEQYYTP